MSSCHFGFEPKPNEEELRKEAVYLKAKINAVIVIQRVLRGGFARTGEIKERRVEWTIQYRLPKAQAQFRGYIQRNLYKNILQSHQEIRASNIIRSFWRGTIDRRVVNKLLAARIVLKQRRYNALNIQRVYRGYQGRVCAKLEKENRILLEIKNQRLLIKHHQFATLIQSRVRIIFGRKKLEKLVMERNRIREFNARKDHSVKIIQRIVRGYQGRLIAKKVRARKYMFELEWTYARVLQSVWRGRLGRLKALRRQQKLHDMLQSKSATIIQSFFRGCKGRHLGDIAKSASRLRQRERDAAVFLQRSYRGRLGRKAANELRNIHLAHIRREMAVRNIQRLFRGHKGRELYSVHNGIKDMESKAKPLFAKLRTEEAQLEKIKSSKGQLENKYNLLIIELGERKREIAVISETKSKFWDSERISGTPQRFVTSLLRVS